MAGWHHQCNGYELEQSSGDGEGRCRHNWGNEQQQQSLKIKLSQGVWKRKRHVRTMEAPSSPLETVEMGRGWPPGLVSS